MGNEVYEYSRKLVSYVKKEYNALEKKMDIGKNIRRNTRLSMGHAVEDCIAKIMNDILNNSNYEYIVDASLTLYDKGKECIPKPIIVMNSGKEENKIKKKISPDIMVIDKRTREIIMLIEVKAQLGWSGKQDLDNYSIILDNIKQASYYEILKYHSKKTDSDIFLKVSSKVKYYNIILLGTNHFDENSPNEIESDCIDYYVIYGGKQDNGVINWYSNIDYRCLYNDKKHNFEKFIKDIKKN